MKFNAPVVLLIIINFFFIIFQFRTNFWERDYDAFGLFLIVSYFIFLLAIMQMKTLKSQKIWFYIFSSFIFLILLITGSASKWKEIPVIFGLVLVPIITFIFGKRLKKGIMLGKKE